MEADQAFQAPRKAATLQSIARAAGVHQSTAARALDPKQRHRISEDLVERITIEADRQGYRRNVAAAALRTGRSKLIGVMLPDLANPVFAPILSGVSAGLARSGYSAIVVDGGVPEAQQLLMIKDLVARQIDGIVLATAQRRDRVVDFCIERHIPTVLVNRAEDGMRVPAVVSDDIGGMRLAVDHLVSLGHRKIGHLAGPQELSTGVLRKLGFEAAMLDAGLAADAIVISASFSRAAGKSAACRLLTDHPGLTAIVAGNDLLALGAYLELGDRKLACPADISIVGHNDMPLVDMVDPPMTTVRIGHVAMGEDAASLIIAQIERETQVAPRVLTSAELIIRASTASLKGASLISSQAIRPPTSPINI